MLGICYGQQTMCQQLGGAVATSDHREFGRAEVEVTERSVADAGSRVLSELDPNAKPAALSLDERTTPPPEEMLFDQIRAVEQELGRLRKLIRSP